MKNKLQLKSTVLYSLSAVGCFSIAMNLFSFRSSDTQKELFQEVKELKAELYDLKKDEKGTTKQVDEHILVEIYEVPGYEDKGVHIHYGGNKREVIPFKEFKKENHDDNGDIIINAINRLERDGYDLTHIGSGLAQNGMITKIFMVKRK